MSEDAKELAKGRRDGLRAIVDRTKRSGAKVLPYGISVSAVESLLDAADERDKLRAELTKSRDALNAVLDAAEKRWFAIRQAYADGKSNEEVTRIVRIISADWNDEEFDRARAEIFGTKPKGKQPQ